MAVAACAALAIAAGAATALATSARGDDGSAIAMTDQDGRTASTDWRGRTTVLDFVFAGCGDVCPMRTADLAQAREDLPDATRAAVRFASVTIDPDHDDPAALKAYATRLGADQPGWSFLTGTPRDVTRLATRYSVAATETGETPSHVETLFLIDRTGRVAHTYVGERIDRQALDRDIAALEAEAAPGS